MSITIEHDAKAGRFFTQVHGHLCLCDYRLRDGVMAITHTEVAPELEGQGIAAAELVRAALAHAREQGLKVRPAVLLRAGLHAPASRSDRRTLLA